MGAKILTVDDSKTIRMIVARAFKSFDCEIMEGTNGVEGLAVATREKPDVIILDVTMPVMDGTEMLRRLKANPDLKPIPVVMLTAEAGRDHVLQIARMGVRDYLVKPFKEDQIVERVGRIISLKNRNTAAANKKRFDDPINLLLVDDKIAIQEQIRSGLADTTWKVDVQPQALLALESIAANIPDVVLVSLSLPGGAGFVLFQKLRGNLKTERLPVFALSVKTAVEEQVRAQQLGFTGTITKPIDTADLKIKIARALNLDASYKYFNQKEGVLVLSLPANFSANIASDITMHLGEKVTEAVDAGVDTLVIDLSSLKTADNTLVELGLHVMKLAQSLSLKTGFVGAEMICEACKNYQETKEWTFAGSFDEIMMTLQTERSEVV